jgi:hypothetical protein
MGVLVWFRSMGFSQFDTNEAIFKKGYQAISKELEFLISLRSLKTK